MMIKISQRRVGNGGVSSGCFTKNIDKKGKRHPDSSGTTGVGLTYKTY
jgi:hypothetical protein